jgi:hypothetical protein
MTRATRPRLKRVFQKVGRSRSFCRVLHLTRPSCRTSARTIRSTTTATAHSYSPSCLVRLSHSNKPDPLLQPLRKPKVRSQPSAQTPVIHTNLQRQAQDGRDIQPADITEQDVSTYINVTNAAISPFDLEIRDTLSQHDRTRIYALVNVSSDSITQLATTHTPDEIAFVKRCLDAMFETNNTHRSEVLAIKSSEALRLAKAPANQTQDPEATQGAQSQSLTMMQAQRMLQAMVDEGWFEVSKKDFYTLTPRALMELRGWLVETYNDEEDERIKNCSACKAIITMVSSFPFCADHELSLTLQSGREMSRSRLLW